MLRLKRLPIILLSIHRKSYEYFLYKEICYFQWRKKLDSKSINFPMNRLGYHFTFGRMQMGRRSCPFTQQPTVNTRGGREQISFWRRIWTETHTFTHRFFKQTTNRESSEGSIDIVVCDWCDFRAAKRQAVWPLKITCNKTI